MQAIKMKRLVSIFVLCALIGINQARIETIFDDIEDHELIGQKSAYIEGDPSFIYVSKKFTFPSVRKIV